MAAQTRNIVVTPPAPPGGWATGSGYAVAELSEPVNDSSVPAAQGKWEDRRRFVPFDASGSATLTLICNDDPAVEPAGSVWKIWWVVNGQASPITPYTISTSLAATVNLSSLTPASSAAPPPGAYVPTDPAHTQIGAPTTGNHAAGEVFVDANGAIWACSIAGTPGTWFAAGSGVELGGADLSSDPIAATTTVADIAGLSVTFTAPARAFIVELLIPLTSLTAAADDLLATITDSANTVLAQALMVGGNASFPLNCPPAYINARLPRVAGGVTAYAITPGTPYTFKARQRAGAGTAQINTAGGQFRPLLRAVTC